MQAEVRKGRVGSVVPKERWRLRCRCSGKGRQWQEGCAAAPRPSRRTLIIVSWFQYLPVDRVSSRSRRGNWGSLSEDSADFTITWAQVLLQMTEWFSPRTSVYTHTRRLGEEVLRKDIGNGWLHFTCLRYEGQVTMSPGLWYVGTRNHSWFLEVYKGTLAKGGGGVLRILSRNLSEKLFKQNNFLNNCKSPVVVLAWTHDKNMWGWPKPPWPRKGVDFSS